MHHVLDRWGLPRDSPPSARRLESLHAAWLRHMPFENISKLIVSDRRRDGRRRSARRFWIDHFRWGTGGTCFDLTSSFAGLLEFAGFAPRFVFCRLPGRSERSHVALLVPVEDGDGPRATGGSAQLVDVGFALPCPIPLPADLRIRRRTRYYDVEIRKGVEGEYLVLTEDRRGVNYRYSFRPSPVSRAEFDAAWEDTFLPDAPYMHRLALGRFREAVRYIYKGPSSLYLLSRSRHRVVEMNPPDTSVLSRIFGVDETLIRSGITILGRDSRSA